MIIKREELITVIIASGQAAIDEMHKNLMPNVYIWNQLKRKMILRR